MCLYNIVPPTIGLSIQNAKVVKGHNSDKIIHFSFFFFSNQVVYHSAPISSPRFKAPVQIEKHDERMNRWIVLYTVLT